MAVTTRRNASAAGRTTRSTKPKGKGLNNKDKRAVAKARKATRKAAAEAVATEPVAEDDVQVTYDSRDDDSDDYDEFYRYHRGDAPQVLPYDSDDGDSDGEELPQIELSNRDDDVVITHVLYAPQGTATNPFIID